MEFEMLFFLITTSTIVTVSCIKYEHISDCRFYDRGLIFGNDNITFVCGESNNEARVILDLEKFNCSNSIFDIVNLWVGTVNFENCRMHEVRTKFFKEFTNIHTFNISDLELTHLQPDALREANNLTHILAARNRLAEIPALLFFNTKKLIHTDFSMNSIKRVDSMAFVGARNLEILDLSQNVLSVLEAQIFKDLSNLKSLNLSYNKFTEFDARILPASLQELDLSSNSLTSLTEHTFEKLINLKLLDLSFNSIVNLNVKTFAYQSNLEHLKLRQIKLSDIRMGTFSHQHNLVTLDLSENELQHLDFKLFSPVLSDLKSLQLASNQLKGLHGFRNSLFPQLTSLDINNNPFSCSYLIYFLESISLEKLRLVTDPNTFDPSIPSVRGIKCDDTDLYEPWENKTAAKSSELNSGGSCLNAEQSNADIKIIKVSLVLIFLVMLTYFVIFVVLNRDHISKHLQRPVANYWSSKGQSTNELNVDLSHEEI